MGDPLEKEMATHSNILAWEILCTEESGMLQSTGSQRLGHELAAKQQQQRTTTKPQKQTTHSSEIKTAEAHSAQRPLRRSETKDAKNKQKVHLQTHQPFNVLLEAH